MQTRHKVAALATTLALLTYFDRACLATLAPALSADLGLSKIQLGWIFSAFATAYALFGLPAARVAEHWGARLTLAVIVTWWSLFTGLTGLAWSCGSLIAIRFLFGAGEAGAWPGVAKAFSTWIPKDERGRIQGIFFSGAHLSAALTPAIVTGLLKGMSWRWIFALGGLSGLAWSWAWYSWFRNSPGEHPAVTAGELARIRAGGVAEVRTVGSAAVPTPSLGSLLSRPSVWALCGMYFPNTFAFYFCITWLPTYLREKHGFSEGALLFYAGLPFGLSVIADLSGGWVVDAVSRRWGLRAGRSGVGGLSFLVAAAALAAVPFCAQASVAGAVFGVAVGASMFGLPAAWAACVDIGGAGAATVSAAMNTAGQVGAFLCPLVVAYSLQWFHNWDISVLLMSVLFLLGAGCWAAVYPRARGPLLQPQGSR